jgi:hypothetical protein
MINSDRVVSIFSLAVSGGALYYAKSFSKLGGSFPRTFALFLGFFGLILLVESVIKPKKENLFENVEITYIVGGVVGIGAYVYILPKLGFLLASIIFFAFFNWGLSENRKSTATIGKALISGLVLSLLLYILFRYIFSVSLPKGVLG